MKMLNELPDEIEELIQGNTKKQIQIEDTQNYIEMAKQDQLKMSSRALTK